MHLFNFYESECLKKRPKMKNTNFRIFKNYTLSRPKKKFYYLDAP